MQGKGRLTILIHAQLLLLAIHIAVVRRCQGISHHVDKVGPDCYTCMDDMCNYVAIARPPSLTAAGAPRDLECSLQPPWRDLSTCGTCASSRQPLHYSYKYDDKNRTRIGAVYSCYFLFFSRSVMTLSIQYDCMSRGSWLPVALIQGTPQYSSYPMLSHTCSQTRSKTSTL